MSKITDNTLLDEDRLTRLRLYAELVADIPGNMAEVGSYRGGSAYLLADAMRDARSHHKLYVFDTFEGMPATQEIDFHQPGDFSDTSMEHVEALLAEFGTAVSINKGIFPLVCPPAESKFSLVHLDCDIFTSVRDGLKFFWPRMLPGGFIVLDDVFAESCLGARKAAFAYAESYSRPLLARCQSQAVFRF